MEPPRPKRHLLTAETLSIGSELTVGDTRDTNAGELARALTAFGVRVVRMTALPDGLDTVTEAFRAALSRSDLVVSTGGLGPTPDDLTREAIAAAVDETVAVDPALERWLRRLWSRRGMPFLDINLKQAWLIPSAAALPNPNGTAPGWLVRRPDGRVIVALPGPPREMRPMWHDHALPELKAIGLGADVAVITYRLSGIGESLAADLLGEPLLRTANPIVATYARAEAVDVRISAVGTASASAATLVDAAAAVVRERLGAYIWATGETTWSQAIGSRLDELGWSAAIREVGTGGQVRTLFGDVAWIHTSTTVRGDGPAPSDDELRTLARQTRDGARAEVGLAVHVGATADDMTVTVAVVSPRGDVLEHRSVFLGGTTGRIRAALAAASILLATLGPSDTARKP